MNKPVHVNKLFEIETRLTSSKDEITIESILESGIRRAHPPNALKKDRRNYDRDTNIQAQLTVNETPHKILDMSSTGLSIAKKTLCAAHNRTGSEIKGQIDFRKNGRWFVQKAIFVVVSRPSEDVIRLHTVLLLGKAEPRFSRNGESRSMKNFQRITDGSPNSEGKLFWAKLDKVIDAVGCLRTWLSKRQGLPEHIINKVLAVYPNIPKRS